MTLYLGSEVSYRGQPYGPGFVEVDARLGRVLSRHRAEPPSVVETVSLPNLGESDEVSRLNSEPTDLVAPKPKGKRKRKG